MNTKLIWRIVTATLIMLTLTASPVAAEEPFDDSEYFYCCQGNFDNGGSRNYRWYNSKTVETLDGEVTSLDTNVSRIGNPFQGTHLMIKTAQETIEVHVAPSWYLAEHDFNLSNKEKIEVIGSRINIAGEPAIIAREIRKGEQVLILRDQDGIPLWSGRNQW